MCSCRFDTNFFLLVNLLIQFLDSPIPVQFNTDAKIPILIFKGNRHIDEATMQQSDDMGIMRSTSNSIQQNSSVSVSLENKDEFFESYF